MGNRVISYWLKGFEVFLKIPVIIILRFGENNVLGTIYIISIYINFEWFAGMVTVNLTLFAYYS